MQVSATTNGFSKLPGTHCIFMMVNMCISVLFYNTRSKYIFTMKKNNNKSAFIVKCTIHLFKVL